VFKKFKARIYQPRDIFFSDKAVIVFMDGWRVLSPEETL